MCASYMMRRRNPDALLNLVSDIVIDIEDYFDKLIVPYRPSPAIVRFEDDFILTEMQFSMVPRWSPTPKVKFATHNARLDTISIKPTWKDAFVKRHCIIPMTGFIEPIYENEDAGFMVEFSDKSQDLIFAAGIYETWSGNDESKSFDSFSIITKDPPKYVAEVGHDRCPIFLNPEDAVSWIEMEGSEAKDLVKFLEPKEPPFVFTKDRFRPMKPGWEKRK